MTRFLGALLLAFAPHLAPAQDAVAPEDARAVRAVIEAQLDAFRRDDAARAFSLATPGIRATFGDAETFMDMVRRSYAAVYRPSSVAFEAPLVIHGELVQPVRLTENPRTLPFSSTFSMTCGFAVSRKTPGPCSNMTSRKSPSLSYQIFSRFSAITVCLLRAASQDTPSVGRHHC